MSYPYFPIEEGVNIVSMLEPPELVDMLKKSSGQSLSGEQFQQALTVIILQKQIYPQASLLDIVEALLQVSSLRQLAIATKQVFLLC